MLDPLVYRAAFLPVLFAVVLAAFSLGERPQPMRTTLSADAFDGEQAFSRLQQLARAFPDRRPGSAGDEGLARVLAADMRRAGFSVTTRTDEGRTIDGTRRLTTVVATRTGQPGKGIVVVADRSAARRGAVAELSATAALAELARLFEGRSTRRTLTLVSTSGGGAGAAAFAEDLAPAATDAVLVLGDLASTKLRKPWVLPWSDGSQLAPVRLRRTAEAAVRNETGQDAGRVSATSQLARLAFPFAIGDEGRFNERGIPAVMLQATGERGPAPGAAVSADHMRVFGRAALRTISALDGTPAPEARPGSSIVTLGKVLPRWSVQLLVGALLLPAVLAAIDVLARARRQRIPVALWLRWIAALAAPFAFVVALARLLGATGIVAAPIAPIADGSVSGEAIVLAVVAVAFVLSWLLVRPLERLAGAELARADPGRVGPVAALVVTTAAIATVVWVRNPYAAALLLLPAHLWLLSTALRLPRAAATALLALSVVPCAAVIAVYAGAVGLSIGDVPWSMLVLVASGHVSVLSLTTLCALAGCAVAAAALALRPPSAGGDPAPALGPAFAPAGAELAGPSRRGEATVGARR